MAPGAGNLVSGNNKSGVQLENADTTGNQIIGNRIGLGVSDATPLGNSLDGVKFQDGASTNTIGTGNLIAHNGYAGVLLLGVGHSKEPNYRKRDHSNAERSALISAMHGVTPNDAGDSDAGPNDLQNFPLLTGAFATATGTLIEGTLGSAASKTFTVEFLRAAKLRQLWLRGGCFVSRFASGNHRCAGMGIVQRILQRILRPKHGGHRNSNRRDRQHIGVLGLRAAYELLSARRRLRQRLQLSRSMCDSIGLKCRSP